MYQDLQSTFSQAQTIAGAAATPILSTNVIDMGLPANVKRSNALYQNPQKNVFDAAHIPLEVQVVEAVVGATGGVTFEVIQSATSNMATPDVLFSVTVPTAQLVKGYELKIKELPMGITKQFVALRYTPITTLTSAGKVTSFIPTAKQLN